MFAITPRLTLRPGWAEDAPALAQALGDAGIARNLCSIPSPFTLDDAQALLTRPHDPLSLHAMILLRTQGAPRLIGGIGFAPAADETPDTVSMGYWIARPYWGLGFATEAARHAVSIARAVGHRRIVAAHFHDNPASGAVLRKLGFAMTNRARLHSVARGACVESIGYALELTTATEPAQRDDALDTSMAIYRDVA